MPSSTFDELARTRALFEQWRAARQGRSKIPDELWQAAASLHGRYSASQLCRELRLSAGALRSRLPQTMPTITTARPAFVPLSTDTSDKLAPLFPTAVAAEIRLVWERADGTRLHLCLPPSQWAQAEALCTAFLRS
jgi:hypothetical protein